MILKRNQISTTIQQIAIANINKYRTTVSAGKRHNPSNCPVGGGGVWAGGAAGGEVGATRGGAAQPHLGSKVGRNRHGQGRPTKCVARGGGVARLGAMWQWGKGWGQRQLGKQ